MIDHLRAMQSLIEARFTCHLVGAPDDASYPYVIVGVGYERDGERPASDRLDSLDADVRVNCVGTSAASALGLLRDVRQILSPDKRRTPLAVPGRRASLKFLRHEMTEVDRDVAVTATGTFPVFAIDSFHL